MSTIPRIIENQLVADETKSSFTFLCDCENNKVSVSLREIREHALKIARRLPKKSTVLICLPQGISFIKAFIGCLYAQAIAVPVAIPTKGRGCAGLTSIIKDADISVCLSDRKTLSNLQKWFGEDAFLAHMKWLLIEKTELDESDDALLLESPEPDEIAFLQYTSGSTGNPKAVIVTHENIVANSQIIQKCFKNSSDSISVCWLPSFHDMGLIDGIIQPIFSGFHAVLMNPTHFIQKPVRWFKAITEYRATYSGAPNFAFDFCCNRIKDEELVEIDLSSLRCLYNGSETIRATTIRRFVERFSTVGFSAEKMFTCYGLAEATLAVTTSWLGSKPTAIKLDEMSLRQNKVELSTGGSSVEVTGCGYADEETNIGIINPETLEQCGEGEVGEVWVAGKSITLGYYNNPLLTQKTFVNHAGKRFLRTGDLGFLLQGELFVTGRIKDLILIRGKNHYPQDIEQTVSNCHPDLQANGCAAFSVEINQEENLVVIQEVKRTSLHRVDYDAIITNIMAEVSYKHGIAPYDVVLIAPGTLPKTTSGKIQHKACKQLWLSDDLKSLAHLREYADC